MSKRDYLHLDALPLSTADELAILAVRRNGRHRRCVLQRLKPRGWCRQLVERALAWYHAQERHGVHDMQAWFCERAVPRGETVVCPYCKAPLTWLPCRVCRLRHYQIHNGNVTQQRRHPELAAVPMVRRLNGR